VPGSCPAPAAWIWSASWTDAAYSTKARMPSAYAFCIISIRRTSGWWVMVTRGAVLSAIWARSAPWTRVLAYSSAFR